VEGANQAVSQEVGEESGQEKSRQRQKKRLADPLPGDGPDPVQWDGHLKEKLLVSQDHRCGGKETDFHLPGPTPPGEPHITGHGLPKLRPLHGNRQTPELERKIGRGTHHSAVPVQEGDRVADSTGKEPRSAVRLLCGELSEEGRGHLELPAQLPLLNREKVGLEASAGEQDLPCRQEEYDGEKGAQEKSSDGQLSPSGTLKR
jgi:hypothetical protein